MAAGIAVTDKCCEWEGGFGDFGLEDIGFAKAVCCDGDCLWTLGSHCFDVALGETARSCAEQ